jgi:alanine dehydrogenase
MPGAMPRTSTLALNNATLPYTVALANKGLARAIADDESLRAGVNTYRSRITCRPVAESQGRPYVAVEELL